MDFIKKTICLEGARARTQGLMPYYVFGGEYEEHDVVSGYVGDLGLSAATGENGNWGQFVANPWFLAEFGKTYEAMLRKYYDLLNMVREGVKLRKVETKDKQIIFTEDLGAFEWVENCPEGGGPAFNEGTEPDFLYEYAAYDANDFYSTGIESLRDETKRIYRSNKEVGDTFIVLIEDYEAFNELASYLDRTSYQQVGTSVTIENGPEHFKWARYCQVVDACIGKINIPASIYNKHIKVPKSMPCADVQPYIDWLTNYPKDDCCNARLYDDMGGDEMLAELLKHQGECTSKLNTLNGLSYSVPYIEMPILLIQNYTDVGVLTNIDGIDYDDELFGPSAKSDQVTRPHGTFQLSENDSGFTEGREISAFTHFGIGVSMDQIIMDTSAHTDGDIEVESLLQTLRNKKKYTDDKDNILPGDFLKFEGSPGGKMFKCTKTGGEWVMSEESSSGLINGDGRTSEECKDTTYYRTITTCAAGIRIAETEEEENGSATTGSYYFLVKYDNSSANTMTIPYKVGNATNIYLADSAESIYRGDFIIDASSADGKTFKVTYVVGGYFSAGTNGNYLGWVHQESGDVYYEEYGLDKTHVDYVALDGVDNVPVWSEYIDFEGAAKEFYSTRYGLTRTGNTATIVRLTSGDIWNKDFAYDAYLTKEEYLTGFSLPPKADVNVTVDRGGVSAFEKHYKLTECNTMQDLVNYGNNFFNI